MVDTDWLPRIRGTLNELGKAVNLPKKKELWLKEVNTVKTVISKLSEVSSHCNLLFSAWNQEELESYLKEGHHDSCGPLEENRRR